MCKFIFFKFFFLNFTPYKQIKVLACCVLNISKVYLQFQKYDRIDEGLRLHELCSLFLIPVDEIKRYMTKTFNELHGKVFFYIFLNLSRLFLYKFWPNFSFTILIYFQNLIIHFFKNKIINKFIKFIKKILYILKYLNVRLNNLNYKLL